MFTSPISRCTSRPPGGRASAPRGYLKTCCPHRPVMAREATKRFRTRLALRDAGPRVDASPVLSGIRFRLGRLQSRARPHLAAPAPVLGTGNVIDHVPPGRDTRDVQAAPEWSLGAAAVRGGAEGCGPNSTKGKLCRSGQIQLRCAQAARQMAVPRIHQDRFFLHTPLDDIAVHRGWKPDDEKAKSTRTDQECPIHPLNTQLLKKNCSGLTGTARMTLKPQTPSSGKLVKFCFITIGLGMPTVPKPGR